MAMIPARLRIRGKVPSLFWKIDESDEKTMSAAAEPRVDPTAELATTLETFSPGAEQAAIAKCSEHNFAPDRGPVPLVESFINLRSARALLQEAVTSKKLQQLPLTVQAYILADVREVSRALTGLIGDRDEVVNLSKAIEELHVTLWQYRLDNLSPELLGYQTKLNELKRLEREISDLKDQLKGGVTAKKRLEAIVENSEEILKQLSVNGESGTQAEVVIASSLEKIRDLEQETTAIYKTAQQTDNNISALSSNAKASAAEASTKETRIREFFEEISEFKTEMETASELQKETAAKWEREAKQRIEENEKQSKGVVEEMQALETEIQQHLQKAVGASLFHSFAQRQTAISSSKDTWFKRLEAALMLSFLLGATLVYDLSTAGISYSPMFFLKLSLSVPFVLAVYFCASQYARERRLEEEYAFKSNISVSLIAYKDLVDKMVDHKNEAERQKYTDFIIGCIQEIFESPTRVDSDKKQLDIPVDKVTDSVLNGAAELVKAVRK
jgi:hypothetical protein